MILNYIKLSFRKFTRQKFYSLLNILGLATGMVTVVLILLYVVDELSYDKFHRHADNLYRVVENQYYSGQPVFPVAVTPGPLAEALEAEFPEVQMATRMHFGWNAFQHGESRFDGRGIYADPEPKGEDDDYKNMNGAEPMRRTTPDSRLTTHENGTTELEKRINR